MRSSETDPYLEPRHQALFDKVRELGEKHLRGSAENESDPEGRARAIALRLGGAGILAAAVPPPFGSMDLRSLVVVREALAYYSSLADMAFANQGLGSAALSLAGTDLQKSRWLPAVVSGQTLCAFAATEPEAGSDLAAVRTKAEPDGALWRLSGLKTCISNAGIAGLYTVLARSSEAPGHRGLSLFLMDAEAPGLSVRRLEAMAPHPIGELRLDRAPAVLLGTEGRGYSLTLTTLETFRPSVGAAACGLAERALDEAVRHALARRQFGRALSDFQATQMALADMHVDLAGARLLVRHAAFTKDRGAERITREAAVAKLAATEMAQRVVDRALQIHGGQGVMRGSTVERLYREVRALRIDQGASEIQKLVIAATILKEKK